jgi:chromosome segregation ATPase
LQQAEFDRSKEKILELELAISEKGNDLRKAELKMREKDYEIQELKNATKELQGKASFLHDKMETEKEAASKLADMKAQSYEDKLKTIRAACKEVERREQEKTVKYNKLKSKLEKYEL